MNRKNFLLGVALAGFAIGSVVGATVYKDAKNRALMERQLRQWNEEEWKQNLLDDRVREFMDQMERKHS